MSEPSQRKKSPRAPSISLDEALERATKVYAKERLHSVPVDVVAQDIGYKSANNGAALAVLASLRYYGLMDRTEEGQLAVSKSVEEYQFAPNEDIKRKHLIGWLKAPPVFADLLERYASGLPSDATLRFDLIKRGFSPITGESVISVFRKSTDFVEYFDHNQSSESVSSLSNQESDEEAKPAVSTRSERLADEIPKVDEKSADLDKIPVRLPGGRRAWLVIPTPFFAADKDRLIAQINLLLTEDDEDD